MNLLFAAKTDGRSSRYERRRLDGRCMVGKMKRNKKQIFDLTKIFRELIKLIEDFLISFFVSVLKYNLNGFLSRGNVYVFFFVFFFRFFLLILVANLKLKS